MGDVLTGLDIESRGMENESFTPSVLRACNLRRPTWHAPIYPRHGTLIDRLAATSLLLHHAYHLMDD